MDGFNTIEILKKIGWYDHAEAAAHEKLTSLFKSMCEYFQKEIVHTEFISKDIYVGGYYPINPESSFCCVIKKGYKYIDTTHKSIHQAYKAYCEYLQSPVAHSIAHDLLLNPNLEFYLIDDFISKTYEKIK